MGGRRWPAGRAPRRSFGEPNISKRGLGRPDSNEGTTFGARRPRTPLGAECSRGAIGNRPRNSAPGSQSIGRLSRRSAQGAAEAPLGIDQKVLTLDHKVLVKPRLLKQNLMRGDAKTGCQQIKEKFFLWKRELFFRMALQTNIPTPAQMKQKLVPSGLL